MEQHAQPSPPFFVNVVIPSVFLLMVVWGILAFVARRKKTTVSALLSSMLASGRVPRYLLLAAGAGFGYIGSYFGQSGLLRTFASLGDYLTNAREILVPPQSATSLGVHLTRSVCLTAWVGVMLGVVLMGAVIFYVDSTKKRSLY